MRLVVALSLLAASASAQEIPDPCGDVTTFRAALFGAGVAGAFSSSSSSDGAPARASDLRVLSADGELVITLRLDGQGRSFVGAECEALVREVAVALGGAPASPRSLAAPSPAPSPSSPPSAAPEGSVEHGGPAASAADRQALLAAIEELETEQTSLDTGTPTGLLIGGAILTALSIGVPVLVGIIDIEGTYVGPDAWVGSALGASIGFLGGVALLTIGAVWMVNLGAQRGALRRRIDDRRRLLHGPTAQLGVGPGGGTLRITF